MNYENNKQQLLNDENICKENKDLFKKYFEWQEYKLKRQNSLNKLDEGCLKTLQGYVGKLRNVNAWFHNKPLKEITKADIKRVYDGLEDGTIKTAKNKPFKDRQGYYSKVFKSKLFEMIGKADLCREVMEFTTKKKDDDVRFIKEDTFRKLVSIAIKPEHKLLLWLSFDVGENINTLLKLQKKHFTRQTNEQKEPEYVVNLPKDYLKRSRTARSELTNYVETTELLDILLPKIQDDERVFKFEYRMAKKLLDRAVKIVNARCIPKGQKVTWKDLRSSMACDLLSKGWHTDEINSRLGHVPSSSEIDKYVNFLAINKHEPKAKIFQHDVSKLRAELDEVKGREKLLLSRLESVHSALNELSVETIERLITERLKKRI